MKWEAALVESVWVVVMFVAVSDSLWVLINYKG